MSSQDVPDPMKEMLRSSWPLVLGLAALAIPAAIALSEHTWSSEAGAHGPLVLCTAAWLLWRQWGEIRAQGAPGRGWIVAAATIF